LVEADELLKDNGVTIVYKDYAIQLAKKGMYRFDSEPPAVRVYDGGAVVLYNGKSEEIKPNHMLEMTGELKIAHFDKDKSTDELYLWSRDRSQYLAMANVAAAQSVNNSGMNWGGGNSWAWNPFFGMYTFIPMAGTYYNPFGWAFYSPYSVYSYLNGFNGGYYYPPYASGGGGGGSTPGHKPVRIGHGSAAPARSPGGPPRGLTPAAAAMRSSVASNARAGGGAFSGSSGGHSGGFSSSGSGSALSSSSHSSGSFGGGGGHSSGGGGGHGK